MLHRSGMNSPSAITRFFTRYGVPRDIAGIAFGGADECRRLVVASPHRGPEADELGCS